MFTTVSATSTWTQTSDSDFGNGTLDGLSILDSDSDAKLLIDFPEIDNSWTEKLPITTPIRRSSHAMATIYNTDQVLLFGGYYYDTVNTTQYQFQDTWIYDFSDNMWLEKNILDNPGYRYGHEMAAVFGTDKVVLFGGYKSGYINETWVYDLSDNTWIKMNPKTSPSPRYLFGMASVYGDDKIVLHGGSYGSVPIGETWVYDLSENSWVKKTQSTSPGALRGHELATISRTDKIILFGGMNQENHLQNETWIYDISDNRWSRAITDPKPAARYLHGMTSISSTDRIVLFGGYLSTSDTWIYDFSDNTWTRKELVTKPSARYYPGMASVNGTTDVVLFGGISTTNKYLNDTWIYEQQFSLRSGTFDSQPFKLAASAILKDIILNATTSMDNSLKFQLRSAAQKAELDGKPFLGPDGVSSSFYTSFPAEIWEGHRPHRWIQYKAYFETTNIDDPPVLNDVTISFNYLPTNKLIYPSNRAVLPNNFPVFNWTFNDIDSSHQIAFQVLIGNDLNFDDVVFDSSEQNSDQKGWEFPVNTSYSYLPTGTWYWKVRTKDSDGDWGLFSPPWQFIIDSRAPWSNITWPEDGEFYYELNKITGQAANYLDSNDINKVEISIKCQSDNTYWDGSSWQDNDEIWLETLGINNWLYNSSLVKWTSGFQYAIQSRAVDFASNIGSSNAHKFIFDTDYVLFSNAFPKAETIAESETLEVGITISDFNSGVNASSIEYVLSLDEGMSWGPWLSVPGRVNSTSINVSVNLILSNGTGNRIRWRASDLAGNGPSESEVYVINVDTRLGKLKPKVDLINPINNSIVSKSKVELQWSLINKDLKGITYDILLDTNYPPVEVIKNDYTETSLVIEDLSNEETYYWMIIPKNGAIMGECLSGVWSFSVEFDFLEPLIVLNYPSNEQSIITTRPTLDWYVDYYSDGKVSFDIYFDTNPNPKLIATGHSRSSYTPDSDLEDQQTYYWKVVPKVDNKISQGSEIWWFTVDVSYNPIIELRLTLSPSDIVLKPEDFATVTITVKNFGKYWDTISLNAILPQDASGVSVILQDQQTAVIAAGDTLEFNLTVVASSNAQKSEITLSVQLISQRAVELNLESEKYAQVYVTILDVPDPGPEGIRVFDNSLVIFSLIILIILIIVGYTRVEKDRVFRNVLRKVIHKTIEDNPGIHFRKLMRNLGLKPGTLSYHMNILEKQGYIKSLQKGIYRCFYLTNTKSDFKIVLSTLQQNILFVINENPGITLTELSNTVGKNKMVLNYNTHKLEDAGMIKKEKKGRIVSYTTTSLAAIYIS